MGVDQFGNKYYEDLNAAPGQTRYVIYGDQSWWFSSNAQNIPSEWHAWMHYTIDETPYEAKSGMQIPVKFLVKYQLPNSNYLSKIGSEANYLPPGHYLKNLDKDNDYLHNVEQGNDYVSTNYSKWTPPSAQNDSSSAPSDKK